MALENIKKRAEQEQSELEQGIHASLIELEGGKVAINYNGKEFEFPRQQPAWVSIFFQLNGKGDEKELSDEHAFEFIVKLVGKDLGAEIVAVADNNMSLSDIVEQIVLPVREKWAAPQEDTGKK